MPASRKTKKEISFRYLLLRQDEQNGFLICRHAPFFLFSLAMNRSCSFKYWLAPPERRQPSTTTKMPLTLPHTLNLLLGCCGFCRCWCCRRWRSRCFSRFHFLFDGRLLWFLGFASNADRCQTDYKHQCDQKKNPLPHPPSPPFSSMGIPFSFPSGGTLPSPGKGISRITLLSTLGSTGFLMIRGIPILLTRAV